MTTPKLKEILISEKQIQQRVLELGKELEKDYKDKDLVLVGVLKGSVIFLADLSRAIEIPHSFDFIGASSYGAGTTSSGHVQITRDITFDLKDRHVVLVEDIYDTGNTMEKLIGLLLLHGPASVEVCAMLYKDRPRVKEHEIRYRGFEIEDKFVVGYGLDLDQYYRNLRDIWVMG